MFSYAETAALEYARFQAGFTEAAVMFDSNSNSSEQAASSKRTRSEFLVAVAVRT